MALFFSAIISCFAAFGSNCIAAQLHCLGTVSWLVCKANSGQLYCVETMSVFLEYGAVPERGGRGVILSELGDPSLFLGLSQRSFQDGSGW